jgi:hypothetical protein
LLDAISKKRFINWSIVCPRVESNAQSTFAVVESMGDERAAVRKDFHGFSIGWLALYFSDGSGKDPRVPRVERFSSPRL